MNNNEVNLWFAKDEEENIITINEVKKEDAKKYCCPICGSGVKPKQGKIKSWHFAHEDKSKCNSEAQIHWWFKNKFLIPGDKFIVKSDIEKEYICKEILVEQNYEVNDKVYNPDVTIITGTGETIYFEMANTNKKKVEEYLDMWIGLGNIVVEVDIKALANSNIDKTLVFDALYFDGKCFNINKSEEFYYDTIGKLKEGMLLPCNSHKKESIQNLDWFWTELQKYKIGESNIEKISICIDNIVESDIDIVADILKRQKCNDVLSDYMQSKNDRFEDIINKYKEIFSKMDIDLNYDLSMPHAIYDRLSIGLYVIVNVYNYHKGDHGKISENIRTIDVLEDKLKNLYKSKLILENMLPIITKINNKYKYGYAAGFNKIRSEKISIDQNKEIVNIDLYDIKDFNLNIYPIEIYNDELKMEELINKLMIDNNIAFPVEIEIINSLNLMVKDIEAECSEKYKSVYKEHEWYINSQLTYDSLILTFCVRLNGKERSYSNVIISFFENEVNIGKEKYDLDLLDLDNIKDKIIKAFRQSKIDNVIIQDSIYEAMYKIKIKYEAVKNIKVSFMEVTPISLKVKICSDEDSYGFYIYNNKLYKMEHEICNFNDESSLFIFDIFSKIIDRQLYLDIHDLDNDIVSITRKLMNKYSNNYNVKCDIQAKYNINLTEKYSNRIINSISISSYDLMQPNLESNISEQFSNSIRKEKYGNI